MTLTISLGIYSKAVYKTCAKYATSLLINDLYQEFRLVYLELRDTVYL